MPGRKKASPFSWHLPVRITTAYMQMCDMTEQELLSPQLKFSTEAEQKLENNPTSWVQPILAAVFANQQPNWAIL